MSRVSVSHMLSALVGLGSTYLNRLAEGDQILQQNGRQDPWPVVRDPRYAVTGIICADP